MNSELSKRCQAAQLVYECGAGGSFTADTAIIAEAPGEREVELKMPLCGGSGKMLWDAFRREGVSRNNVYITNVVKKKLVSTEHNKKLPISKQELSLWKQVLLEELSFLPNLKYVVLLGNYALEALTAETGIMQWRGSVLDVTVGGRQLKAICTYNPAYVMREPKTEIVFRMDLNKLTLVRKGEFHPEPINTIINPSYEQAMEYIYAARESGVPIAYDIEVLNSSTACIGLAYRNDEGICIAFHDGRSNYYSHEEERSLRSALQSLFTDARQKFVAQNGHFDASWLWYMDRIRVRRNWFDTMLAHHVLYPPLPHNLGFLTAQYTHRPYYKDDGKEWRYTDDIDTFWRYNVTDCCVTRIVHEKLLNELEEQELDQFFFNHVMELQPSLVRMTVGGILCDVELKEKITDELRRSVDEARVVCNQLAATATGNPDYTFNPRSYRDLSNLFFRDLKLVGRGSKTDKENRDRMRKHPRTSEEARMLIDGINEFLANAKFLSTYAESRLDDDNRFRCEYSQVGVSSAPGRLSSRSTMWKNGLNMQNIPPRGQDMFITDPGFEFSYFDGSQIEARFVACFADIPRWKEQFELARLNPGSYDAHCALAADMFKVPYDEVPKSDFAPDGTKTIRFIAKRCRHGLNYRMGPDRLATTAGLSLSEAEAAYRIYHRETPQLRDWWDALTKQVRESGYLVSPLGRRWLLLERFDDSALESIVAFLPQSTAGDWVASCIYKCERDPRWPKDARMAINVHDALIAINRIEDGPLVRSIMKEYMEEPIHINRYDMIVPAEFGVSQPDEYGIHRWSTIKKIK